MNPGARKNAAYIALALGLVVAVVLGRWIYLEHRKSELQKAVTSLVQNATVRARAALGAETELDAHAAQVEADLRALKSLDAGANPALVSAAENYLAAIAGTLQYRASSVLHRGRALADGRLLGQHMRTAMVRDPAWIREAIRLKKAVEKDYYEYRIANTTLAELLGTLPEAGAKLALYVPAASLLEETLRAKALGEAGAGAQHASRELDAVRKLALPPG